MSQTSFPKIEIVKNAFSADIDHRVMSGGTFDIRKIVKVDSESVTIHPLIVVFPDPQTSQETHIHQAIHTLEHGLAYTGGVRDELVSISQNAIDRNTLIDISPFQSESGQIGFRMLALFDIDHSLFETAVKKAAINFAKSLSLTGEVPFANERQCGQFRFHDSQLATKLVDQWAEKFEFKYPTPVPFSSLISVADLRLLKPQLSSVNNQQFLTPQNSYYISQKIEELFDQSWQSLGFGKTPKIFVGTYGCMTGMYLTSEYVEGIDDKLHTAIARILLSLYATATSSLKTELEQITQLIASNSPQIFDVASQEIIFTS
ncbi:MAG: S-ribosylhomocysteine lyase [Candidatus Shapirobacteria bacterium]|jgi:S-ribosylhomocysteine lyase LuxS involved in autoinducer biosynthesis